MDNIVNVDERDGIVVIEARDPAALVDVMNIPVLVIEPQTDPVYGYTFKMPEIEQTLALRAAWRA